MYRAFVEEGKLEPEIADAPEQPRGPDRGRTALDPRAGSPGSDQSQIRRRQRLEPHVLQAEEGCGFAIVRTCGSEPMAPSSRSCERHLFDAAQAIIQNRSRRMSDDEMLERLKTLYQARGLPLRPDHRRGGQTSPPAPPTALASAAWRGPISWSASRRTATFATSRSIARCATCMPRSSWRHRPADHRAGRLGRPGPRQRTADGQQGVHGLHLHCPLPGDGCRHASLADPLRYEPDPGRDRRRPDGPREPGRPGLLHPAAHRPARAASRD